MQVVFIGVGEAFDEHLANTSVLVAEDGRSVLLDCGFTAAQAYWKQPTPASKLDALWISHFHGDHFFGVPALLLRFWEERRTAALDIVGQPGIQDVVTRALDLAYPGFLPRLGFELRFHEAEPKQNICLAGFTWSFAKSAHMLPCLGVRLDGKSTSIYYSGDGAPTDDTQKLASGCDLVVHETFDLNPETPGHGSVPGAIDFARQAGAHRLALVHIRRTMRHTQRPDLDALVTAATDVNAFVPEPGEHLAL